MGRTERRSHPVRQNPAGFYIVYTALVTQQLIERPVAFD